MTNEVPIRDLITALYRENESILISEIRCDFSSLNIDTLEPFLIHELSRRRDAFMECVIVKQAIFSIGLLFYDPVLLSRQLIFIIKDNIAFIPIPTEFRVRLRIQLLMVRKSDGVSSQSILLGLEHEDAAYPWMGPISVVQPLFVPKFSKGVLEIKNDHVIKKHPCFVFPTGPLGKYVHHTKNIETGELTRTAHAAATREEVIKHYMTFSDLVFRQYAHKGYEIWYQEEGRAFHPDPLDHKRVEEIWAVHNKKLLSYLNIQLDRGEEMRSSYDRVTTDVTTLCLLLHFPTNEKDNYVSVEYVALEATVDGAAEGSEYVALTLDATYETKCGNGVVKWMQDQPEHVVIN